MYKFKVNESAISCNTDWNSISPMGAFIVMSPGFIQDELLGGGATVYSNTFQLTPRNLIRQPRQG